MASMIFEQQRLFYRLLPDRFSKVRGRFSHAPEARGSETFREAGRE